MEAKKRQSSTLDENLRVNLPGKTMWAIIGGVVAITLFWANFSYRVERVIEKQNEEFEIRKDMQNDIEKMKDEVVATRQDIAVIKTSLGIQAKTAQSPYVAQSAPVRSTTIEATPTPQKSANTGIRIEQRIDQSTPVQSSQEEPKSTPQPTPNVQPTPTPLLNTIIEELLPIDQIL